jgi:hypothetical protein
MSKSIFGFMIVDVGRIYINLVALYVKEISEETVLCDIADNTIPELCVILSFLSMN